jgi:hypothetical protein
MSAPFGGVDGPSAETRRVTMQEFRILSDNEVLAVAGGHVPGGTGQGDGLGWLRANGKGVAGGIGAVGSALGSIF